MPTEAERSEEECEAYPCVWIQRAVGAFWLGLLGNQKIEFTLGLEKANDN